MPITALNRWLVVQAALWSVLLSLAAWSIAVERFRPALLWVFVGLSLGSYAFLWMILRSGRCLADLVTLLRFAGLLVAAALVARSGELGFPVWGLLVAVVASDLVDGWCARTFGGSEGGAVLDMETDQLTTLGLSLIAAGLAGAGVWTLLLPGFRYAYVLGLRGVGLPSHDPKPREGDNRRGRLICAAVMVLLLLALCPVATLAVARVCTIVAVLALAYSFSSDAAFLWRHRGNALRTG